MAFQRKKLASALAFALGGGAIVAAAPVLAQDIRIEVTGSNIRRVEAEQASPVQTLTRQSIESAGFQTINEALQTISAAGFALDDRFGNGFAPGAGGLNLRNLGFNSTLILVNGRRLPTYPFAQQLGTSQGFNDLNSIPVQAIERIDVLKDGASAVYGADAVAGVVNIILKKDYRGYEFDASVGTSQEGDGTTYSLSAFGGWGDLGKDGWNFVLNANYFHRDDILSRDRDFARTEDLRPRGGADRRSSYGYPGNIFDTVTGERATPNCGPATQFGGASLRAGLCRYDRALYGGLLPETDRYGVFGSGEWRINNDLSLFGEASWARNSFYSTGFPAPTDDANAFSGIIIPVTHPQNPFPNPAAIRYRFDDVGTRDIDGSSDIWRLVGGFKGTWKNWDWQASGYWSQIKSENDSLNNVLRTTAQQVFDEGKYDFINQFTNSPELINRLRYTTTREGESEMWAIDAKASGEIWQLPAGPLAMAFGGEFRNEKLSDVPDEESAANNVLGSSAAAAFGERDVTAGFVEFNIPVVKTLEMSVAARYDHYSYDGGGSFSGWSPKVGLRWQPNRQLLVRSTYGRAFRAPSLFETTIAQQSAFTFGIQDPVLCPEFDENNNNCVLDVRRFQQGNPSLEPENTNVFTAGVVWEPNNVVNVGVEYWDFRRKNEISSIADQLLVNLFPNDARYVQRNAAGEIQSITQQPINLAKTDTNGIDVTLGGRSPAFTYGRLTGNMTWTYVMAYDITTLGDDGDFTTADLNGGDGYPRLRGQWSGSWLYGAWENTLSGYYVGSYEGFGLTGKTDPYAIWNYSLAYSGFKNWTLRFTVQNVLNTDPPFYDSTTGSSGGWDFTLADPRGRYYSLNAVYKF